MGRFGHGGEGPKVEEQATHYYHTHTPREDVCLVQVSGSL